MGHVATARVAAARDADEVHVPLALSWLEPRARAVGSFDALVLPGCLQTEGYGRANIAATDPDVSSGRPLSSAHHARSRIPMSRKHAHGRGPLYVESDRVTLLAAAYDRAHDATLSADPSAALMSAAMGHLVTQPRGETLDSAELPPVA